MSAEPNTADERADDEYVIERLGGLLAQIAVALKGQQPAGTLWSYHDLPELVRGVIRDRDLALFQAKTNKETIERMMSVDEIRRYVEITS